MRLFTVVIRGKCSLHGHGHIVVSHDSRIEIGLRILMCIPTRTRNMTCYFKLMFYVLIFLLFPLLCTTKNDQTFIVNIAFNIKHTLQIHTNYTHALFTKPKLAKVRRSQPNLKSTLRVSNSSGEISLTCIMTTDRYNLLRSDSLCTAALWFM